MRQVRVENLPPEVPDTRLRDAMSTYGDVKTITEDRWSKDYRCPVCNGVRIVEIGLTKHIPSRLSVVGNRVLILFEGQPITCYESNETGHQLQDFPTGNGQVPPLRRLPETL